jgi:hypothetical protein
MPVRITRSRRKGYKKPIPDAVSVSRPGPWGNDDFDEPEKKGSKRFGPGYYTKATAALLFHRDLLRGLLKFKVADVQKLRGKHVMCWCAPDEYCHGDVLLEIANS